MVRSPLSVVFELTHPLEVQQNFNWYRHGTRREHGAHQGMWEPLFVLDRETGELEGWLAETIEPNDAMDEWTLTLRRGVKWSDGKDFDADDVVYTVEMVLREERLPALEAAEMRAALKSGRSVVDGKTVLNGIEKVDDQTVVFKLKTPDPRFALKHFGGGFFGSFLIMPEHEWPKLVVDKGVERYDPPISEFVWKKPIGTGPYVLESYTTAEVVWQRRTSWWGVGKRVGGMSEAVEMPEPEQLIWRHVADEASSKTMLVNNDLDAAREYSLATFQAARTANPAIVGWSTPAPAGPGNAPAPQPGPAPVEPNLAWAEPCTRQLEINTQVAPWNDHRVRKALSHLIDRKQLAQAGYGGAASPSRTMFYETDAMAPYVQAVVDAGYGLPESADLAKAAQRLAEAGYQKGTDGIYRRDGTALAALITVNGGVPKDVLAAQQLEAQLDAAGLEAALVVADNGDYWGRHIPTGDYMLAYGWLSCGSIAEPYTSMSRYRASVTAANPIGARTFDNTGRWGTAAAEDYEVILDKIAELPLDDETIPGLVAEAYAHIDADTPFIPLVQSPRIVPFNTKHWVGWPSAATGGVPMHGSGDAHVLIHALKKAPPQPPQNSK